MRNLNRLSSPGWHAVFSRTRIHLLGRALLKRLSEGATVGARTVGARIVGARIVMLGAVVVLAGCVTANTTPAGTSAVSSEAEAKTNEVELRNDMAQNLVSMVPQLLEPLSNTIQFNESTSGDVAAAVSQLVTLGYGMQRVDADQGKYFLKLEDLTQSENREKNETRLRLTVGSIELSRTYRIVSSREYVEKSASTNSRMRLTWRGDQTIIPASPMLLAGSRLPVVVGGFELAANTVFEGDLSLSPGSLEYTSAAPISGGIPSISLITDELVQQVAQASFPGIGLPNMNVDSFTLENMTHVFDEAFASLSDNYTRVARETVIFPNDSQVLGRPGKLVAKKVIEQFSVNSDLIGIVGCSNGYTNLSIGNEGLALGRAKRIAEELYTAGISRDKVFNEGCWSPDAGTPGFPNRGVVIDLWRRKG